MTVQPSSVGPVYDLLLQTRDGSALSCRNKDGKIVNVSQVAYCTSIDRQGQGQHEETEIQHKDQLVQLSSSNLIDREFNQWPQVSQGDWSGGTLQRVLTGSTPITSFGPQSDPTRYWDGYGIIWPVTDYLPQRAFLPPPFSDSASSAVAVSNVSQSNFGLLQPPGSGFAFMYLQAGNIILTVVGGLAPSGGRLTLVNPVDVTTANTNGGTSGPVTLTSGHQALWYALSLNASNTVRIAYVLQNPQGTLVATHFDTIPASVNLVPGMLVTGQVGNQIFLAIALGRPHASGFPFSYTVRLYNLGPGSGGIFSNTSFVDLDIPLGHTVTSILFSGSQLLIATTDGINSYVVGYSIPSASFSDLARIANASGGLRMCEAAGSIFITSANSVSFAEQTVDLYLLQGSSLQHIAPLSQGAFFMGSTIPVSTGFYACFAAQDLSNNIQTFAYDVLRGRLFRLATFTAPSDWGTWNDGVNSIAALPMVTRPAGAAGTVGGGNPTAFVAQWGLIVSTLGAGSGTTEVQEMYFGVQPASASTFLRTGLDLTSSLIDFTSAQPKLFRQLVATWANPGLPASTAITVELDAWLDQNPDSLSAIPDFTTGAVGVGVNGGVLGQTQLKLPINKIATKIVYRVAVMGPNSALTAGAVKLISVVVQAATGWVQTLKLDLAPLVQSNSKNGNIWELQSTPGQPFVDHVVAYNFLRQLWRLRGGEVAITLPNGDSGNWLIQDMAFDSPKPMAASFRADQQMTYQTLATVKLREDV